MDKIYRILGKRGNTTIPFPLRVHMGLHPNDLLSYQRDGDCIVIRREKVCDNCGQGEEKDLLTASEELQDFVASLPVEAQRELFLDLSVRLTKLFHGGQK